MRTLIHKLLNLPFTLCRPFCCLFAWTLIKIYEWPQIQADKTPKLLANEECQPKLGETYCIFAMHGPWGIGRDALRLFEILREEGVNTIVVANGKLPEADRQQIKPRVHRLLLRKNLGRDFGAYRAATLLLYEQEIPFERLIYLNDSIYYFDLPELRPLVRKLQTGCGYDVVTTSENHEFSHHAASYALSLSPRVANSELIRQFWKNYRPYNIRDHAIHAGEIRLTRLLKKLHPTIEVVYSLEKLAEKLQALTLPEILASLAYLPNIGPAEAFEVNLYAQFPAMASSLRKLIRGNAAAKGLTPGRQLIDPGLTAEAVASSLAVLKSHLIHKLIMLFSAGSQVHLGFGHLRKYLALPFIKKDLFFRDIYLEDRLPAVLEEIGAEERNRVMRLLLNRGRVSRITDLSFRLRHYLKLV